MEILQPNKVSVVMCTYNGERFIREQLDSLLSQTYPLHEILIQDDLSTDSTNQIICEYQKKYSNIRYCRNEQNLGYNENFKQALYKASGDLIAISDQDDIWMPDKIELLVNRIGDHLLVFSKSILFDNERPEWGVMNYRLPPNVALEEIAFRNNISGHAMLFKVELLDKITYWDNRYYYDWWIAIVAAYFGHILYIDIPLVRWRRHHLSVTERLIQKKESTLGKVRRLGNFLMRRSSYLHALHTLLSVLEEKERSRDKYMKIIELTYDNNGLKTLIACMRCVSMRNVYYPEASSFSLRAIINSFLKPIRCRGF